MLPIHLMILVVLRREGPQSVARFNEGACDGLFRRGFISIVRGHDPAVIQITEKGNVEVTTFLAINNVTEESLRAEEPETFPIPARRVSTKRKTATA